MFSAIKNNEEDVFKEGIFVGFFFLVVGLLLLVVNSYIYNVWLKTTGIVLIIFAGLILFMVLFISITNEKAGTFLLQLSNESLYVFLGIPMASICLLLMPVSIYMLFFDGTREEILLFSLVFTVSLQLTSLIYSGIKMWINNRSSGHKVPVKTDKGPIEQLLYKIPTTED